MLERKPIVKGQNKKFLLCLDNAEDIIADKSEVKKFKVILTHLIEKCDNVNIILTSAKQLGRMQDGCMQPTNIIVPKLK